MSEQQILPGAEAFYAEGNHIGVLVIHGYTGSPHGVRYLAESLAQAKYTVALPRLAGHGTTPADMATTTTSDWLADLHTALDSTSTIFHEVQRPVCAASAYQIADAKFCIRI